MLTKSRNLNKNLFGQEHVQPCFKRKEILLVFNSFQRKMHLILNNFKAHRHLLSFSVMMRRNKIMTR